ncbi:MAG: hypothetical protein J2P22_07070, partial [Nocardioides sp.]|nr:hypothetical protein [Nocardioides sp.]
AWFRASAWADELARAAMVPADLGPRDTPLPELVDLPYELLDSAVEAVRHNRADLVPMLAAHPSAAAVDAQGDELRDDELASIITTLATDARGRLRALVADVSGDQTRLVGVVSWVLLADGWRALRPHRDAAGHWVEVRRVSADDLAGDLAFVLSEVVA